MQTRLEVKGIKKRTDDAVTNANKVFGVSGNEVQGRNHEKGYDINGGDARKGGNSAGSISNHLNNGFDFTTGGDSADIANRDRQLSYVIPGQVTYSAKNYYSDVDDIKIDTSKNIGQVIIY